MTARPLAALLLSMMLASPIVAQTGGFGGLGGLSGMLGGGLPNIGGTGAGNAAGLLGYCVKNNVLAGANAKSVLGALSKKAGIADAPGFAAGEDGKVKSGGSSFSLDALKGQVRTKVCGMVLDHAKSFL